MIKEHPFIAGAVAMLVGIVAWRNRSRIVGLFQRLRHPLSGFGAEAVTGLPSSADPAVLVRQIRRYTFASMQDKSPIVGLTHASYALVGLDTLEEMVGRDAIRASGYDPVEVRRIITQLQDKHAEALRGCDMYISSVLAMEKGHSAADFALTGGAPLGA